MKPISLLAVLTGLMCLSSCSLLRSATQLPIRTLQGLGRGAGFGIEQTEPAPESQDVKEEKPVFIHQR